MARRDDKLIKQVAERIRELRKAHELTQDALREDTGLHIKNIESKGVNVTISSIAILCKYFEISLEEFFKGMELN